MEMISIARSEIPKNHNEQKGQLISECHTYYPILGELLQMKPKDEVNTL
jgi:hypothetical protein